LEFVREVLQDICGCGSFGVRQLDQDEQPAGALHQGADDAGIVFALDEVTLPVSRKLPILDLCRAQVDTELIGNVAVPILALAARDALVPPLSQTGDQFLAQFAHRLGIDTAANGCCRHAIRRDGLWDENGPWSERFARVTLTLNLVSVPSAL
jgi:hypothetical protein